MSDATEAKVEGLEQELADAHDDIRALTVRLSDLEYAAQAEMSKVLKAAVVGMLKVGFTPNEVVGAVEGLLGKPRGGR